MLAAEPSAFEVWWTQFLNIAYPALQMLFWLVMIVVAIIAVVTFKRWVDAQVRASDRDSRADKRESASEISVEAFVE